MSKDWASITPPRMAVNSARHADGERLELLLFTSESRRDLHRIDLDRLGSLASWTGDQTPHERR